MLNSEVDGCASTTRFPCLYAKQASQSEMSDQLARQQRAVRADLHFFAMYFEILKNLLLQYSNITYNIITFHRALRLCPELNPKLIVNSLILNGKVYNTENIHTTQVERLLPKNVFTRTQGGMTAYFSKFSPLSKFIVDGKEFHSVKQYFMFREALAFNDNS